MADTTTSQPRPGSLRALIGNAAPVASPSVSTMAARVDIDRLEPNPKQYRTRLDQAKVEELAASIKLHGQIEAISYRRTPDGKLHIIGGERRWRAIRLLRDRAGSEQERVRWSTIEAHERAVQSDDEMLDLAITENLQRVDPDEVDTAAALAGIQAQRGLATADLARHFGIKVDRAKRLLRLNGCPEFIKDAASKGLMVPLVDDDGDRLTTDGGRERQEHRALELMAALEFGSLFAHIERARDAAAATKKTEAMLRLALVDGWPFRIVQERCRREKERLGRKETPLDAPSAEDGDDVSTGPHRAAKATPSPFRDDERQLIVYRSRLAAATPEQRAELRATLESLLRAIAD